jgi:hypothetical protein
MICLLEVAAAITLKTCSTGYAYNITYIINSGAGAAVRSHVVGRCAPRRLLTAVRRSAAVSRSDHVIAGCRHVLVAPPYCGSGVGLCICIYIFTMVVAATYFAWSCALQAFMYGAVLCMLPCCARGLARLCIELCSASLCVLSCALQAPLLCSGVGF